MTHSEEEYSRPSYSTVKITNVTLDGVTNGIAAFVRSKNIWIKRSDNKGYLFPNFDTLEARLYREEDLEYHDIQFFFVIVDKDLMKVDPKMGKSQISINDALKTETGWKVTRVERKLSTDYIRIYNITEINSYQVVNINYITTKDSNTHDPNHKAEFEYQKLKNLRSMVKTTIEKLAAFQCYGLSIKKNKFGMDIKLDNTTAHIHIWTNAHLMDYNTAVKKIRQDKDASELRCLPFLKDQDKYGSMYMFITCEESDIDSTFTKNRINQIVSVFNTYINDLYPDCDVQINPCPWTGKITLTKEVNWYEYNT